MARKLKAVLFDLDGTMADTDPVHKVIFKERLAEHGIDCTEEYFNTHISGRSNPEILADILPHLSVQEAVEWADDKEAYFRELAISKLEPLPGLMKLLQDLKANDVRVSCVTNAPRLNAEAMLRALKLDTGVFEHVVLGGECPKPKPSPVPYQIAMEKMQLTPQDCLIFEDSVSGVVAAAASQCATVGILTSHPADKLTSAGAHVCVQNFEEVHFPSLLALDLENIRVNRGE